MQVTLIPAYGRKYATVEDMVNGWKNGEGFHIYTGPYCNIHDVECMQLVYGITSVVLTDHPFVHVVTF